MLRLPSLTQTQAGLALLFGGILWGLFWIPVRLLGEAGLMGPWAGIAINSAGLLVIALLLLITRTNVLAYWRVLLVSGAFAGTAFGLYTMSLAYTEVTKSILLFYLTPVWSAILGRLFLGEKFTPARVIALTLGLGGMIVILGDKTGIPTPENIGDWMALASGVIWSIASLGLFKSEDIPIVGFMSAFLFGGLVLLLGVSVFIGLEPITLSVNSPLMFGLGMLALVTFYVLPMLWLTLYPATLLSPVRVGLLLMSEVLVGLASAALLSGEPFGWREAVGGALIVSAAVFEIFRE
ncbi:MAG: DMT family transporter [Pseudomonadota bacterium]